MVNLQGEARREHVARMFTRIARRYDLMNSLMTLGMHHAWRREAARLACGGIEGPALDVAAGTGDLTLALSSQKNVTPSASSELALRVAKGQALTVGLDLLPVMLQLAAKKALRRGAGRVHFVAGDALRLPFRDSTFACAACAFGLRNMPDVGQALAEMVRVVRPGGAVVTLEIVPLDPGRRLTPFLRLYFRRVVPWLGGLITGNREDYAYLPESAEQFPTAERLAGMMNEAGLRDVTYRHAGLRMVAIHRGVKPGY